MISKRKLRDKAVEAEKEKQTGESDDRKEKDKGKDITDRLKDANIGPIRMSDRKSGEINIFGERKLQTCKVQISKLDPDITRSVLDRQMKSAAVEGVVEEENMELGSETEENKNESDKSAQDEPKQGPNTLSAIKGEESEKNIMNIVESCDFEEFDITTKMDILDTSKKKIEEIKRKSQEQISQQMDVDNKIDKLPLEPTATEAASKENCDTKELIKEEASAEDESGKVVTEPEPEKVAEKWKEGEKILCFHGPLIYEAKIQQVEIQNSIPKYFIHYRGWNMKWDEWVPEARMLKFCDANVDIQKDLCLAHETKEKAKKLKQKQDHVFAIPKNPSPIPRKGERGRRKAGCKPKKRDEGGTEDFCVKNGKQLSVQPPDNTVESEEQFKTKLEIKIKIPEELKSYIVDDWVQVCRKKRLVVLPAKITADQMLAEYTRVKTINKAEKMKNNKEKAILEVTAGLREYFNVMLSSQLLYRHERAQYEQLLSAEPGLVPCKTYGVVHLLRLFTKLGEILIYTPLSEKSINLLLFYVNDILMYMKKNASLLFSLADYTQDVPV